MNEKNETAPDFKITYDGTWFHNGSPIKRAALAKLFSDRALKVDENGDYWLQTPFEKYPVEVEDVPYVVVDFQESEHDLEFRTNMDECVSLSQEHPIVLRLDKKSGERLPYLLIRDGLYGRLSRSVFYNLVERFGATLEWGGRSYPLGDVNE